MRKRLTIVITICIIILLSGLLSFHFYHEKQEETLEISKQLQKENAQKAINAYFTDITAKAQGEYSQFCSDHFTWAIVNENESYSEANTLFTLELSYLDLEQFLETFSPDVQDELERMVSNASRLYEVYDDDLNYLPEILDTAVETVLADKMGNAEGYLAHKSIDLLVSFSADEVSTINCGEDLETLLVFPISGAAEDLVQSTLEEARSEAVFVPIHYSISDSSDSAYLPDPDGFGETSDPEVIQALLNTPLAKQLIGNRKTVWDLQLGFIAGTDFKYYIDESMLVLIWCEGTSNACGTYMEVFLSDGSQLQRLNVENDPNERLYALATDLSSQANAVAAMSGDFYDHWQRRIGVCVVDGEITRFSEESSDICWITRSGDFIITLKDDIADYDSALDFIKQNDIAFTLCFGPALIRDGVNITPPTYTWGEVNEDFPRAAIAQVDSLHYLSLVVNCARPLGYSDWGCTVKDLGAALMAHNVQTAYTLDGGQTGELLLNSEVVTPLNYDYERTVSDIIFFASAVPG